ncbi:hypothetical protein SAMN05192558_113130 [Actinokineospora alba]|uniref:Uncharacterized protein n=1 Tax=Actinokineospora alba TaxID=504798 RepID=A0A1H0VA30_9PSEU|nr:hypothetical protein [Actinokineospora alba]TDP65577.1 hypothetical protein C8E96_1063 [Actinokineospora alba]SDH65872.1 hypothetical protein SAMN05421871_101884 [Actinokineospora alba]SDP75300.1 hypothetical protein SAMN05192558_113130 [Actinokineospora alba]
MSTETRWDAQVREYTSGGWVRLTKVRSGLSWQGTSRAAQDKHLTRMFRENKIELRRERSVSAADTAAALTVSRTTYHSVRWVGHH